MRAAEEAIAKIRAEGLTGRQLRMARRLAQRHEMNPKSDFDAVRLLRERGIDPFDRNNMIELVKKDEAPESRGAATPGGWWRWQQTAAQGRTATDHRTAQEEPAGRAYPATGRRRARWACTKSSVSSAISRAAAAASWSCLAHGCRVFVLIPTLLCFYYFAFVATPSYATKSEFIVQQAEVASSTSGFWGGHLWRQTRIRFWCRIS